MSPLLTVEREDRRSTIAATTYGVRVRLGHGHEAPILLERRGMSGPAVSFMLNHDLVVALREALQELAEREGE